MKESVELAGELYDDDFDLSDVKETHSGLVGVNCGISDEKALYTFDASKITCPPCESAFRAWRLKEVEDADKAMRDFDKLMEIAT